MSWFSQLLLRFGTAVLKGLKVKVNTELGPARFPRGTARVSAGGLVRGAASGWGPGAVPFPSVAASALRVQHATRGVNFNPLRWSVGRRLGVVEVDSPGVAL